MRWKQVYNGELGKHEMVPVDESATRRDGHFVQDDFEPFVSPLDGAVVSGRRAYNNHCKKHNVVNAAESGLFSAFQDAAHGYWPKAGDTQ